MKLPRRQFLRLAAGAGAMSAISRIAWAQTYPARPLRIIVGYPSGGSNDILARLMAQWVVRANGPAIRHREPARRRQQYRHRGGREGSPGRLYAPYGQCGEYEQRGALRKAQLQFHPRHRAGRRCHARAAGDGGQSINSGQDRSRVHRLCESQSRQDQFRVGRHRNFDSSVRRTVQDDDWDRDVCRFVCDDSTAQISPHTIRSALRLGA
jgi:hypothetical protein